MYGILSGGSVIAKFTAPMTVNSNTPVFATDALSLKRNVTKRTAQRWEITTALEPLSLESNELFSLFVTKGHFSQIDVIMPQNYGAIKKRVLAASTPVGTGSIGATTFTVGSNTPPNTIPKGTFIRFSNHSKVYMLTSTVTGNASVGVFPELRSAVTSTTFNFIDDVTMPCYLETDTVTGMTFTDGILMDLGTVKLVEKL